MRAGAHKCISLFSISPSNENKDVPEIRLLPSFSYCSLLLLLFEIGILEMPSINQHTSTSPDFPMFFHKLLLTAYCFGTGHVVAAI